MLSVMRLAWSLEIPCAHVITCRSVPWDAGSTLPYCNALSETPRFTQRLCKISSTFLSLSSSSAITVICKSACSSDEREFLKSKRVLISRCAWMTASLRFCLSTRETTSNEKSLMHAVYLIRRRLHCKNPIFDLPGLPERTQIFTVDVRHDATRVAQIGRDFARPVKLADGAGRQRFVDYPFAVDDHGEPAALRQLQAQVHTGSILIACRAAPQGISVFVRAQRVAAARRRGRRLWK